MHYTCDAHEWVYKAVSERSRDLAEQGQQITRVRFRKLKIKRRTTSPTTDSQKKCVGEAVEVIQFILLFQGKSQPHQKYYCNFHRHFPPSISLFWWQERFSLCSTCCTEVHQFFCCPPGTPEKKWFLSFPQKQSNKNQHQSLCIHLNCYTIPSIFLNLSYHRALNFI